ncbi:disulfide bond formation protein B [Campylobacter geochelonis]|uniref:DsbB family disulfide bond formation protein n=1 Tax=Campylobacter geochelonis TaxID=1780362 RepID=A0A128EIM5_9BACT|nr:disulfide bond formation protein B [Campylobacter geochelonis]QKF71399.1 DsbB-related disulfide oxidoreductase [Campylobacter geochelonis]CZE48421.1 DsbB family disulfide bond formation protein [Campylobacter geochelonis]
MQNTNKFYNLMSLAVIGIIALPVGIANVILGYILKDSPCTSCWALRIMMIVIALCALFIVRYGLKFKYVALMLLAAAYGIWNAFWHFGIYATLDVGQGQALMIFGLHTQIWAGIVMWAVIVIFALILLFCAPSFSSLSAATTERKLNKIDKVAFVVFFVIVASNAFQALVMVGPPPFTGADSPTRFTLNPKYISWNSALGNLFSDPSLRGAMGVDKPDLAGKSSNFAFDHKAQNSPLNINKALNIASKTELNLDLNSPISAISYDEKTQKFAIATQDWGLYLADKNLKTISNHFVLDHLYFPTVLNFVGVDFMGDNIKVMGYNKAFITVKQDDKADEVAGFADFYEGGDKFSKVARDNLVTTRSKTSYIASFVADEKYSYAITVPDNLQKSFILIKQLNADDKISAEIIPELASNVTLKDKRELGELYITAMAIKDGMIYAASKNYNTIVVIDTKTDEIVEAYSYPEVIVNLRGLEFVDGVLKAVSYQNGKNIMFELK